MQQPTPITRIRRRLLPNISHQNEGYSYHLPKPEYYSYSLGDNQRTEQLRNQSRRSFNSVSLLYVSPTVLLTVQVVCAFVLTSTVEAFQSPLTQSIRQSLLSTRAYRPFSSTALELSTMEKVSRIYIPTATAQSIQFEKATKFFNAIAGKKLLNNAPSMFLGHSKSELCGQSFSVDTTTLPSSCVPGPEQYSFFKEEWRHQARRNQGELGFRIGSSGDEVGDEQSNGGSTLRDRRRMNFDRSRKQSTLHVGRKPSNVDYNAWNWPEPLSLEAESFRTNSGLDSFVFETTDLDRVLWPLRHSSETTGVDSELLKKDFVDDQTENSIVSLIDDDRYILPWIPTRSQIESLTVLQLKEELGRRNLRKNGNKAVLKERLLNWLDQQVSTEVDEDDDDDDDDNNSITVESKEPKTTANSLEEWVRTVDLKPLLERRANIHKAKLTGKKIEKLSNEVQTPSVTASSPLPENFRETLTKTYEKPSSLYSNIEVKQLYIAAKHADQVGNRSLSKKLLLDLKSNATPNDARLYRRLARLEQEDGNIESAIAVLKEGLEANSNNAYLLHGLAQIYSKLGDSENARKFYLDAIDADPALPNSYHALGTMEHTLGRIAQATKILKKGIEYCPSNHRLHHAIGDVYREAKLLDMAKKSYEKALGLGPKISHGFAYTALAYTAYEIGDVSKCRAWLQKAVRENSRSSNAWVAWAQLEESEGNIDIARSVCSTAIAQYEQGLLALEHQFSEHRERNGERSSLWKKANIASTCHRSGDRFFNVYRTWARIEERYGTIQSTEDVYHRASLSFPQNWKLALDLAQYYVKVGMEDKARSLFTKACRKALKTGKVAVPCRLSAEFEMSLRNYGEARNILYNAISELTSSSKQVESQLLDGIPELLYTWGVSEWYMGNHARAEILLQHSLRTIPEDDKTMRAFVLFAVAKLEIDRGEYFRAQHCISLCLTENRNGSFGAQVWKLWSDLATLMGNERLALQCQDSAARTLQRERENRLNGAAVDLMALHLTSGTHGDSNSQHQLLRRDPWHTKIFGSYEQQGDATSFVRNAFPLPERTMHPSQSIQNSDVVEDLTVDATLK